MHGKVPLLSCGNLPCPALLQQLRLSHVTLTKKGTREMPAKKFRKALGLRRLGICRQNAARCVLLDEGERERV